MNLARRAALVLVLTAAAWPAFAADYFWNCTTPDGIKYADATKCDKGDNAAKVLKGTNAKTSGAPMVMAAQETIFMPDNHATGVCPTNPDYCSQPDYGITEGEPRAQAIAQFMRKRACDFKQRFPNRCAKTQ